MAAILVILKSSDLLIDVARILGKKMRLKDYFIGSFIVGIGTSLPEFFTSVAAVFAGEPQLVVPTIYGTIVANIAAGFGLGVIALYVFTQRNGKRQLVSARNPLAGGALTFGDKTGQKRFLGMPIAFAFVSVFLTAVFYITGYFHRWQAGLFLLLYVLFLISELRRKDDRYPTSSDAEPDNAAPDEPLTTGTKKWWGDFWASAVVFGVFLWIALNYPTSALPGDRDPFLGAPIGPEFAEVIFLAGLLGLLGLHVWTRISWRKQEVIANLTAFTEEFLEKWSRTALGLLLALAILVIYLSGFVIVWSVEQTAELLDIADTILAASALAIGTSLPDIVVAIKIARLGRHLMLVGHILQSNTFDVLLVMGICGLGPPLIDGYSMEAGLSIGCSVVFTAALIPIVWKRRITLTWGAALVIAFIGFMTVLFA